MHHAASRLPPSLPPSFEPTEEAIQHRAYLLWKEEGSPSGRDLDIWLRAKELVRHQHTVERPRRPKRRSRTRT